MHLKRISAFSKDGIRLYNEAHGHLKAIFLRFRHSCRLLGSAAPTYTKIDTNTSRKHGKKEPQSFSHCGSFDHLDLQSLNECKFVFLVYQLKF
jgi:hypothetical protein